MKEDDIPNPDDDPILSKIGAFKGVIQVYTDKSKQLQSLLDEGEVAESCVEIQLTIEPTENNMSEEEREHLSNTLNDVVAERFLDILDVLDSSRGMLHKHAKPIADITFVDKVE